MNKDREHIINKISNGSHNRMRENYFKNNFPEYYNEIINYTDNLDLTFKQRLWHWVNEEKDYIKCYCGNKVSFQTSWKKGYKNYCSTKCSSNSKEVREKATKTIEDKYGVSHYSKTKDYVDKVKKTSMDRYGVDNFSKTDEYVEKSKKTYKEKYEVDSYTKTDEYVKKSKKTALNKYGVDSYTKTDEFKERFSKTMNEKYNSNTYLENIDYRNDNFDICKNLYYIEYIDKDTHLFKCDKGCEHNFEINTDNYFGRKYNNNSLCTVCNPISSLASIKEKELLGFINDHYKGKIVENYKTKYEIDVYLPDIKIGFEFNGLYWHSNKFKEKNYHLDKTNYFSKNGIRIIHIWEDDWINNNDIIKSQVLYHINSISNKIYARKCNIEEIDITSSSNFLNNNHIQGTCNSVLKLGMFYDKELVSVMTFDKFEGRKKMNESEWNLNRFCSKKNTIISGASSKFISFFIKNYNPSRIISYADYCWSNGRVYEKLGFIKKYISKPDYKYIINNKRVHKSNLRKSRTKTTLTESQYAINNNIFKVYDCGKIKYEMVLNKKSEL